MQDLIVPLGRSKLREQVAEALSSKAGHQFRPVGDQREPIDYAREAIGRKK